MLVLRSGTMLFALFKAPSAAATVGYLAIGLTLPFAAAYHEKWVPYSKAPLMIAGNTPREESLMQDLAALMEVIVDCNRKSISL